MVTRRGARERSLTLTRTLTLARTLTLTLSLSLSPNPTPSPSQEHESDLESNCGFWLVLPDPDDPNWCTVNYSVAISLKSWAPTWPDEPLTLTPTPTPPLTLTLTLTLALTPTPTLTKAPTWLDSIIAVQGLPKAVAWVKRESEKGLKRRIQSAPDLRALL